MTDEERFFYELGRESYYGGMEYSLIKLWENSTNKVTLEDLTRDESNKKEGD